MKRYRDSGGRNQPDRADDRSVCGHGEKDVVITLTGEMPEGAAASACPVDISMDGVNIISAYDITIYDADGQEFQPSEEKPFR